MRLTARGQNVPLRRKTTNLLTLLVGERARALRGERPLVAISRPADLAPSRVMEIENALHSANTHTLGKLAAGLDVRPTDLLNVDFDADENDLGSIYESLRICPNEVSKLLIDLRRK
jgi:hypothetical protein